MEDHKLTAQDACLIIKAGKDAGARKLKFLGLEIVYGVAAPSWPSRPANSISPQADAGADSAEKTEQLIDKLEIDVKTQQMEELLITDPERLEELLATGELRNTTDGDEEADS